MESTITRWWECEFSLNLLLALTNDGHSELGMWYLVKTYAVNTSSHITRNAACKLITNMATLRNIKLWPTILIRAKVYLIVKKIYKIDQQ